MNQTGNCLEIDEVLPILETISAAGINRC